VEAPDLSRGREAEASRLKAFNKGPRFSAGARAKRACVVRR